MPGTRRALIAGLGLIGGSIGIALRARGWHVAYLDPFVDGVCVPGASRSEVDRVEPTGGEVGDVRPCLLRLHVEAAGGPELLYGR